MNANERRRTGPAVLNRVLGYMLHYYKYLFILVIGCILVSAVWGIPHLMGDSANPQFEAVSCL